MSISPAYLAGFFDGEGSARLQRGFSKKTPLSIRAEVKFTNTALSLLQAIQQEYGGKIRVKASPTRPVYTLYWSNMDDIKAILNVIVAYLILKRELVELLLEYLKHRGSGIRLKTSERDNEIFDAIATINQNSRYKRNST